ncbi:hypothetical protein HBI73_099560 [Parastagonospora nodorum]|nr:hypothetical protein HBH52_172040 [Parastagonospora nodorum]KAH4585135.1 hypothetical protein HBH83_151030 [Parastagonospora nodorum]KAH5014299.1 hypothetical protein HBI77_067960 [Parastagonospora nodorum]KAH5125923.1 hypothetical protein HBI73_099560 [Parastagonospora nodorum]
MLISTESFAYQADQKLHTDTYAIHNHSLVLMFANGIFAGLLSSSHPSTAQANTICAPSINEFLRRLDNSRKNLFLRLPLQIQHRNPTSRTSSGKVSESVLCDRLLVDYLGPLACGDNAQFIPAHPRGIEC